MAKTNLLIVEDDPIQQDLMRAFLESFSQISIVGFVNSGDELIRTVTQPNHQIDALLLDIDLGEGKSGLESYSILRFRGVQLPTVIVTGNVPDASYTSDLGIVDVLQKPFTPQRFRQGIEKLRSHIDYQKFQRDGGILVPIVYEQIIQLPPSEIYSLNRSTGTLSYIPYTNLLRLKYL